MDFLQSHTLRGPTVNCKGISEVSHSISWTSPAGRGQDAHVWFPALLGVLARAMRAGVWSEDKLGEAGLSFHCRFQGPGAGVQAVSTLTCRAISPPPWSGFLRQDPASLSCSVWLSVSLLRCLFAGTLVSFCVGTLSLSCQDCHLELHHCLYSSGLCWDWIFVQLERAGTSGPISFLPGSDWN